MGQSSIGNFRLPRFEVRGGEEKTVHRARTTSIVLAIILGLSAINTPGAYAQQKYSTIAVEKCGRLILGSGKDAEAAERNARYRCRIRGGFECNHLVAPATVPSPDGEHCAAIATHRLGVCRFVAKSGFGGSEEDAKKKAVELCGSANGGAGCQVRSSHWICQ